MQKGLAPIWIIVGILLIAGGYFLGQKGLFNKKYSLDEMNPNIDIATPGPNSNKPTPDSKPNDETASWKTYVNEELSFKFPPELSHFVCGENNEGKDVEIGIDLNADVENKKVGCGREIKLPNIIVGVLGNNGTVEKYLQEIPVGSNGSLSPIQYEKTGIFTVGYNTRSDTNNTSVQVFYAFENPQNKKIYHSSLTKNDPKAFSQMLRIISTFKFTN